MLLLALGGCQTSKSSTPTAPTVAGPIPGRQHLSAPVLLEPAQGFKFKENEQPIRLVVQNATSNGVRSADLHLRGVRRLETSAPRSSAARTSRPATTTTSVQIDRLEIGRAYYWRAWAEDGANTGATATAGFEIHPKPAVTPPVADRARSTTSRSSDARRPTLTVGNANFVGPVGHLAYEFQVATRPGVHQASGGRHRRRGSGQTTFNS